MASFWTPAPAVSSQKKKKTTQAEREKHRLSRLIKRMVPAPTVN